MSASQSVKALVESILLEKFGGQHPFKGEKPFVVVKSDDDRPRALVNDELLQDRAVVYEVAVTCDEQKEANRFVYQYSHELAHFWFTPLEHPFLEVCAVAVSLSVLSECSRQWASEKRFPPQYGPRFQQYRTSVVESAKRNLREANSLLDFMPRGSNAAKSTLVADEHILAGSFLADSILDRFSSWGPLLSLNKCLCLDEANGLPLIDFDLWSTRTEGNENDDSFITEITSSFAETFGVPRLPKCRFCPCF